MSWQRHGLIFVNVGAFLLLAAYANPLRETPMDDDWAYTWTARHLADTGEYVLHPWVAPNMPFQAAWGAAFIKVFGFSFAALRMSTLILLALGLFAFYGLCRQHRFTENESGLLVLVLWTSPLVFLFGFMFMTDVPYLSLLIVSLYLYGKAFESRQIAWAIAASLTTAAAILTRQFAVAIVCGVVCVRLTDSERWKKLPFYAAGIALPILAGAWQVYALLYRPNWAAISHREEQLYYLTDIGGLALKIPNVIVVSMHYLALFATPLVIFAARWIFYRGQFWIGDRLKSPTKRSRTIAIGAALVIAGAATLIGFRLFLRTDMAHDINWRGFLMPYLPWYLWGLADYSTAFRALLTAATLVGALILGIAIYGRYRTPEKRAELTQAQRLLDFTTGFLLLTVLVFFQLGDEYLLVLLPYTIIVLGRFLHDTQWRFHISALILPLLMGCVSAYWTRGLLEEEEARWRACEWAAAKGGGPDAVYADWKWTAYHSFDEFERVAQPPRMEDYPRFFDEWLPMKRREATYWVVDGRQPAPDGWQVMTGFHYKQWGFRLVMFVVERNPATN